MPRVVCLANKTEGILIGRGVVFGQQGQGCHHLPKLRPIFPNEIGGGILESRSAWWDDAARDGAGCHFCVVLQAHKDGFMRV